MSQDTGGRAALDIGFSDRWRHGNSRVCYRKVFRIASRVIPLPFHGDLRTHGVFSVIQNLTGNAQFLRRISPGFLVCLNDKSGLWCLPCDPAVHGLCNIKVHSHVLARR